MKDLNFDYCNKKVTPFGGMILMKRFIDKTGIMEFINQQDLPQPKSNAGYSPLTIIQGFWISVWLGANKFSHTAILRFDQVLKEIFNWKRCPSDNTYQRFFQKFDFERSSNFFYNVSEWFFEQLKFENFTLDVDSSVWIRYGQQQGAAKGYNPRKRGRNSHHPLMAFVAEVKMVANFWLRPGNTSSSNNILNFLDETFRILKNKKISLLRADAGFYSKAILEWLETKTVNYIIAIKMYPVLKVAMKEIKTWRPLAKGITISEMEYKSIGWSKSRRVIVIRQSIEERPKATGKLLFPDDELYKGYRYHAFVTDLALSPEVVWEIYRKRADAENRIKELEYDFGADNFCMKDFYATEAALRMVMISYNLMSLFRITVLQTSVTQRLTTIRMNCFSIGSWIVKNGNKRVLKMSVAMQKRTWMDGLFLNISNFKYPKAFSY